jgi:hypothetical protein
MHPRRCYESLGGLTVQPAAEGGEWCFSDF